MRRGMTRRFAGLSVGWIVAIGLAPAGAGSATVSDDIDAILDGLQGLAFDDFVDESYKQVLLRTPEMVTSLGLSEAWGTGDGDLDSVCYDFVDDTYRLKEGILDLLQRYPRSTLGFEQQVSYDSYLWLLTVWRDEREFMYHFYPVTTGFSRQNDIIRFLHEEHPMSTIENAEDYISRLEQIDDQFACLVQNLDDSWQRGIIAPAGILTVAADSVRAIVPGSARYLPFYTNFEERLDDVAGLSVAQRTDLLSRAEQAIDSSVIPAYRALVAKLDEQIPVAPGMNGVWQLPDGDRFYRAMLRYHTTTDLSPAEIHHMGLDEVERIRGLILDAFDYLGYPSGAGFADNFDRLGRESGIIPADEIVAHMESIIRQAEADVWQAFDIAPQTPVAVIGGGGSFYVPGSLDGTRPGAFHIANHQDEYRYWMRTIAYHETVPGHHFQISIGNELDVPLFTKAGIVFTGFIEGWALYAERLAADLGWYDDDLYSDLGRLQWELLRAARMVVDTGLHARHWSRQRAIDYYVDVVGADLDLATSQIDQYLVRPGYFSAYKVGMMTILDLRARAQVELGDRFDLKHFHRVVLLHNCMPLTVLDRLVDDDIARQLGPLPAPRRPLGRRVGDP